MNPAAKRRPTIGVTLDSEEPGGYSKLPWYALRQNYCDAIVKAGGKVYGTAKEVKVSIGGCGG